MPWGPPADTSLSESDKKIIKNVQDACHELMDRLGELDIYVSALNSELNQRKQRGASGEHSIPTES